MVGDQSEAEGEQKATEATEAAEEAGEELFEHYQLVADPGQVPLRVDKFVLNLVSNMSRTKLSTIFIALPDRVSFLPLPELFSVRLM